MYALPKALLSNMGKIIKATVVSVVICGLYLSIISAVPAREEVVDLRIEGDVLSAKLIAIPLKDILEKLEGEKGIWFRGDESVLGE